VRIGDESSGWDWAGGRCKLLYMRHAVCSYLIMNQFINFFSCLSGSHKGMPNVQVTFPDGVVALKVLD